MWLGQQEAQYTARGPPVRDWDKQAMPTDIKGAVDTTRADGRLIFAVFAALAEFERSVISGRTRAGLKAARGRKGGRPRKMTASKIRMAMAAMAYPNAKPKDVVRELGVTTTTLYAHVNGDGSPKAAAEAVLHRSVACSRPDGTGAGVA